MPSSILLRASFTRSAATLTELLVAVALFGILAVLIGLGIGHMKKSSQSAACTSNMRQVGLALAQYSAEDNLRLPGPLWRGQTPYYQTGADGTPDMASGNLITFLSPYLNLESLPPGHSARAGIVSCPAWLAGAEKRGEIVCLYSTGEHMLADGRTITPFGRMGSSGEESTAPMSMAALDSPAAVPALREFDRKGISVGFYRTDPRVPEAPVHQTVRNVLYFDGHVAAAPVNDHFPAN